VLKLTTKSKTLGTQALAMLISIGASDGAFSTKGQVPQSTGSPPSVDSVTGNEYVNNSIGMTYVFPEGWFVDTAAMASARDSLKKFVATHDQNGRTKDYENYGLLMVSKSPERVACDGCASVSTSGPSIILSSATVDDSDEHKTGADIQNVVKKEFAKRGGLLVVRGPEEFSIGSQTFSRMDMTNGFLYKGDAIAIRNHIRIEFQFVAGNAEQLEDLYKTLHTLQFKP
jgi:hypothetical protein